MFRPHTGDSLGSAAVGTVGDPRLGTSHTAAHPARGRFGIFHPRTPSQWIVFIVASCFLLFLLGFVVLFGLALLMAVVSLIENIFMRGLQSLV